MPEHKSHQQRLKQLLAQDPEINDTHMKEFRMQLEQALESSEAKAQQTRRRIVIAMSLCLGIGITFLLVMSRWGDSTTNSTANFWRMIVFVPLYISTLAAAVIGVLLVGLHLFKYRPRLNRARFDLQTSMLRELQQQVENLSENMKRREK